MAVNGYVVNGELLGAGGGVDPRVFITITGGASITTACALTPARKLEFDQAVTVSGKIGPTGYMTGYLLLASSITTGVQAVVTSSFYNAVYLSFSQAVKVTSSVPAYGYRFLAAVGGALISTAALFNRARILLDSGTHVTVTSNVNISDFIGYAPIERTMQIPAENRTMELI